MRVEILFWSVFCLGLACLAGASMGWLAAHEYTKQHLNQWEFKIESKDDGRIGGFRIEGWKPINN